MNTANSKEEAGEMRVELARVTIPEEQKGWSKWVKVEGDEAVAYAQPFVVKRLSEEEKTKREAEKKARSEAFKKRIEDNQVKRDKEKAETQERKKEKAQKRVERLRKELEEAEEKA